MTQAQVAVENVTSCSPVAFVCGLSLGATVGMILARETPLRGMVLLAPALFPRMSLKARFLQLSRLITPTVFYHFAGWNGEVVKAMDYARHQIHEIGMPVLAIQATDDRHVSARGLKFIRRHARDADVRLLPQGSHVITRGAAKSEVFEAVTTFVEQNSRGVKIVTPPRPGAAGEPISDPS